MGQAQPHAGPASRPFEPIMTDDSGDDGAEAESAEATVAEPVPPPAAEGPPPGEPGPEPKRRWRRKRKHGQPEPEPAAEVPLEQGRAESVPGPRGMFEPQADDAAGSGSQPPVPATTQAPPPMTRPDAAPITPFERETASAPEAEPEPEERPEPAIVPTPGRYRLPDDFAFGPGSKPPKAERGS